ncbi:MAG: hypothetical protein IJF08_07280, partial [Clostridia bacterium]|nr:hypothetical protein [Clostridia bacterium]
RALGRARRRETYPIAVFLVLFLRLLAQKKNGKNLLNVTHPNPFPTFFFDTTGAKKKVHKKETPRCISPLRRRRGLCPRPATFLKKGRSKTFVLFYLT